jgi:predicted flap endonuclease-1-like 5' DNA nuclease
MLLGAFLLGALLMWAYDKFLFACVEEDEFDTDETDANTSSENQDEHLVKEYLDNDISNLKSKNEDEDLSNLKKIEGIGPKIESILKSRGISNLRMLMNADVLEIKKILSDVGGERYAFHDPST